MTTRRLAAILAADVVGFSSLMGQDEEGTLARVKSLRREVIEPKVTEHHGRVFKTTGDGLLVEFPSPVEAVHCAVAVQETLAARAAHEPSQAIQLRIGINLGDIMIEEDGDVYGDGVNIAARLEQIAEPGGISISGKVYEEVRDKLPYSFEDQGEKQVKNIARPVRVYCLQAAPIGAGAPSMRSALPLPDRPSLAVLPFTNMSGDPEQEYFADGVVEEIITALSRVRWFFVIARNSSFTYKGRSVDIRQVGRELGVRYVLGGSIRKVDNRVRITGQLIEATTGRHLWADRFDGELADIFELQDRITESVVGAIEPSLRNAEIERAEIKPTECLDAYDLYLRALPHAYSMSRSGLDEAISYLRRAYSLDPRFALAKAFTTYFQVVRKAQGWDQPGDIEEGINLARELAHNARDDALIARCVGLALAYLARDYDAALATVQRALELNSNSAQVVSSAAFVHVYVGRHQEALELFRRAMRLNPRDPEGGYTWGGVASSLLALDRLEEALDAARRSVQEMPTYTTGHRMITIALARLGRVDEARQSAKRLLELTPDYSLSRAKHFMGSAYASGSVEKYLAALRLAGIPE